MNDETAYGIYNGFDSSDIRQLVREYEVDRNLKPWTIAIDYDESDYSVICRALKEDEEIIAAANKNYQCYPIREDWSEEYKAIYRQQIACRTAQGYAEIDDDLVKKATYRVIDNLMKGKWADKVKAIADAKLREEQKQFRIHEIEKLLTATKTERVITDEGGKTKNIYWDIFVKSTGEHLKFVERNIFDVPNAKTVVLESG